MKKLMISLLTVGCLSSPLAMADGKLTVDITNLTNALYYTPLLVSAHDRDADVFEVGTPASASLQAMAEGGDISGLATDLASLGANNVENPAGGLLAPGATATAKLRANKRNRFLSIVAMLLPTNDGFMGLDAIRIPKESGTYTYYLNGYDAGTEANDELITGGGAPGAAGIPADPGHNSGAGASGVTGADHNSTVHIHRGIVGGASSDLNEAVHRWLNPVTKVVITVD